MTTEQPESETPKIRDWDILLIEPDDETCGVLHAECLEGQRVLRMQTAREGDEKLRRINFRLIICADELPDMPGLMLLAQTMELWPATQRILMCRDLDNELMLHALREGSVVHYLPKPVDPVAASRLVDYALEQNRVMENLFLARRLLDQAQTRLTNQNDAAGLTADLRRGGLGSLLWLAFVMIMTITLVLVGFAAFYLFKSAVGIDFFPDSHLQDFLDQ